MTTPTIYIVDDDEAMRQSLSQLLENAELNVKAFSDGQSFLDACDSDCNGCVLLDMMMPGMSGKEVQLKLAENNNDVPVIILTGAGDVPMAVQAMKSGAVDFLEKPVDGMLLLQKVFQCLTSQQKKVERSERENSLTSREREVLQLMLDGLSSKEIARKLNISNRTIEVHRAHILYKMGAKNSVQLAQMFSHSQE
jgi:two-component system response regulator FixJ